MPKQDESLISSHSSSTTTAACVSLSMESSKSPRYQGNKKPPLTPKPMTRSEPTNPYPTTFVQVDTSSFKQVVQMLTGSSETAKRASSKPTNPTHNIPPIKSIPKKQQQSGFRRYERRNSLKNLNINTLNPGFSSNNSGFSPRKLDILSPNILDFPSLVLSPITPLIPVPFDRSAMSPHLDTKAEEKAIKEKGFFFYPSPASTPRDIEPHLLPLFPTTSPRTSGSSSFSAS
ncbi:hypothetical protein SESBI_50092 [Sesbania bispinosa]|nr:hypothetical protein SESBI_50092 [Sesbania bispinosa]